MKRILFILSLLFSVGIFSCQSQDYIGWVGCNSAPTALITTSTPDYSSIYVGYTITTGCPTATSQGLCWNTTGSPTTSDSTLPTNIGSGADNITGLASNTTYYIRVYITSALGTFYSVEISRTTLSTSPTVTTTEPSAYIYTIQYLMPYLTSYGGNVTSDGGSSVTDRGVVYSTTDSTPTIGESGVTKESNGTGTGVFSANANGGTLIPGTTYYIRAFATNSNGTSYGSVYSTTICSRPAGLNYYTLNLSIIINGTYSEFYSSSSAASQACYDWKNPEGRTISLGGVGVHATSLSVGNTLYWYGTSTTDCSKIATGYFLLSDTQNKIVYVLNGVIQSITNCP